ncbi:hypothetical protein ACFLQN_03790 [Candidatus Aenigmatarchaeota archaeon]
MKAQVSNEAIVVLGFILLVFVIISVNVIQKQSTLNKIDETFDNRNICSSLSNEINSIYILGLNSESFFELKKNVTIFNNVIKVDRVLCATCCNITNGESPIFNLTRGFVKVWNNQTIVIENV